MINEIKQAFNIVALWIFYVLVKSTLGFNIFG